MLQAIRDKAQGWIAWAIVTLISIPFALWGIQQYLGGGSEVVVAEVDGQEITGQQLDRRYQQFRQNLRTRLGAAYRPEMFDEKQMRKQVLEDIIRASLIAEEAQRLGLRAGDAMVRRAIMSVPAFQKDGRFDREAYERAVRLQGLVPAAFEQRLRQSLVADQLSLAVSSSAFVTDTELKDSVRLRRQLRKVRYFVVPAAEFKSEKTIPEADLKAYYEKHQNRFMAPEQVKLDYIVLDVNKIAESVKADDASLKAFYEEHIGDYRKPEERRVRHILIAVDQKADKAAEETARKKIERAMKRIQAGEDFAKVAKEVSEDPGSASQGGDLGFFGHGIMDPAFEKAAFSHGKGELVGPIRTQFGYHLIEVEDIKPAKTRTFAEVRKEVLARYRKTEAEKRFYDYAERLSDLAYEDPDSLEPAADALKLKIEHSDWITREGGKGALASPKVTAAAFSDDVLNEGHNSEVIETGPEQALVLRVVDHRAANVKPFEEVKGQIEAQLREQQTREKAEAAAKALLERLQKGEGFKTVAANREIKTPAPIGRVESKGAQVPQSLRNAVFRLPRPQKGKPSYATVPLGKGDIAVVALDSVEDGSPDKLSKEELDQERKAMMRARATAYFDHFVEELRRKAKIEIKPLVSEP